MLRKATGALQGQLFCNMVAQSLPQLIRTHGLAGLLCLTLGKLPYCSKISYRGYILLFVQFKIDVGIVCTHRFSHQSRQLKSRNQHPKSPPKKNLTSGAKRPKLFIPSWGQHTLSRWKLSITSTGKAEISSPQSTKQKLSCYGPTRFI